MTSLYRWLPGILAVIVSAMTAPAAGQSAVDAAKRASERSVAIPRTPDGRPDLQGVWNAATITPLERPDEFAAKPTISEAEAEAWAAQFLENASLDRRDGGPARDRSRAYPNYFVDRGNSLARIGNRFRTSLIVDPPDGRIPALTPQGRERVDRETTLRALTSDAAEEAGTARLDAFDDPEIRPLAERCLLSFGSSSGPPSLPVLYNNLKQIVQTPDYVAILYEMVHDVRIIPFARSSTPAHLRKWLGEAVARWEGDTLVIETKSFTDKTRFRGSTENLRVVERLTRVDPKTLVYRFTIEDPATWTRQWTGEYPWVLSDEPLHEYACHEGNYAFGGILRGARLLEKEAASKR
jgi:hypothetical protein